MYLIGIDLGTTVCKSLVCNEKLEILAEASVPCPLVLISPTEIEQDPKMWWQAVKSTVKEAVAKSGVPAAAVRSLSISAQGISFVPVDRDYVPLRNAFCWLDRRAALQKEEVLKQFDAAGLFTLTGINANAGHILPKLIWLRQNEAALYAKTFKILTAHEFILAKLCGKVATDPTMAWGSLLYDLEKQSWSEEILSQMRIDPELLPEIRPSGSCLGRIKKEIAAELGLDEQVMVVVGGQDQKCAALGAGITTAIATVSLGTASAITQRCDRIVLDRSLRIPCSAFLQPASWVLEGVVDTSGASLKWLKDTLFPLHNYRELDSLAGQCYGKENNLFFYPYLSGGGTPRRAGNWGGMLCGIGLTTSTADIINSVMEGVAFQIKLNLEVMAEIYRPVEELRVFGGGAQSGLWCQIIAAITGKKVSVPFTPETAGVGAAVLAGLGTGIFTALEEVNQLIRTKVAYFPDEKVAAGYSRKYQEYLKILDGFFLAGQARS